MKFEIEGGGAKLQSIVEWLIRGAGAWLKGVLHIFRAKSPLRAMSLVQEEAIDLREKSQPMEESWF